MSDRRVFISGFITLLVIYAAVSHWLASNEVNQNVHLGFHFVFLMCVWGLIESICAHLNIQ
jgi:hypothetical protein